MLLLLSISVSLSLSHSHSLKRRLCWSQRLLMHWEVLQSSMEPPSRMAGPGTCYWPSLCHPILGGGDAVEVGGNRRGFRAGINHLQAKRTVLSPSPPWMRTHTQTLSTQTQTPRVCSCSCCCWGGTRKPTLTQFFPSKVSGPAILLKTLFFSSNTHTALICIQSIQTTVFSSHKRCFTISKQASICAHAPCVESPGTNCNYNKPQLSPITLPAISLVQK